MVPKGQQAVLRGRQYQPVISCIVFLGGTKRDTGGVSVLPHDRSCVLVVHKNGFTAEGRGQPAGVRSHHP